jgi:hypothetical protein
MSFLFGEPDSANVILLAEEAVAIPLGGVSATYVLVVHAVEDVPDGGDIRFYGDQRQGRLGGLVSEYVLEYEDGSAEVTPVLRGFSIQQARIEGGLGLTTAWACVPALDDRALLAADEALALDASPSPGALAPMRTAAGLAALWDSADPDRFRGGLSWIGAVRNPEPELALRALVCRPHEEQSAVYAVALSTVTEHPLRPGVRRKLRLRLPEGLELNKIAELDEDGIEIDLGVVISARAALDYDHARWAGQEAIVQPSRSERELIVEYAAHPQARLYLGSEVYELGGREHASVQIPAADRPVQLRFLERDSGAPVAVRLHLHGAAGEYLPPRGHHRKVGRIYHYDNYAELAVGENQYAYVDGECVADLPLGTVFVEISRSYEMVPIRTSVEVTPETEELVFELERVLRWRERGWVTADTHVHFLNPQTALLEGKAEGVNVVNVLATQLGELFTNVGDFDGKTTFGAEDLGGRGEFLVRVGSENRTPMLGHISLLGYKGAMIHPLCVGGPNEAAFGDSLEVTMAEWAQRCIDQGGIVVLPHAQDFQLEHAADVVLGVVNAVEMMHFNPLAETFQPFALTPYGLADWYRYLNLGYHLPLVGGSDKMSAEMLLGGMRTYVQLGERELTYDAWLDAIRAGNTFATVGPLIEATVEGVAPGGQVRLPAGGGTVQVEWLVESLRVPVDQVEIVVGGLISETTEISEPVSSRGSAAVRVSESTWIAVRARGSYHSRGDDIAAHTSAVQVLVDGSELFSEPDATAVLEQIQGAIAYVDTIAPRPEARRFNQLRATLETAYNRLHQRMHAAGIYHRHPLHDPAQPHEH